MKRGKRKTKSKKKSLGKFKSSIEKYCSDSLRESGIAFSYEEQQFVLMESFRFPHKYFKMTAKKKEMSDRTNSVQQPIRYTPDFVGKDSKWIIETKGYANESFPLRWKLFKKHLKDNNHHYVLFMPRNKTQVDEVIELIKQL